MALYVYSDNEMHFMDEMKPEDESKLFSHDEAPKLLQQNNSNNNMLNYLPKQWKCYLRFDNSSSCQVAYDLIINSK